MSKFKMRISKYKCSCLYDPNLWIMPLPFMYYIYRDQSKFKCLFFNDFNTLKRAICMKHPTEGNLICIPKFARYINLLSIHSVYACKSEKIKN